jgi:hypothetical protein
MTKMGALDFFGIVGMVLSFANKGVAIINRTAMVHGRLRVFNLKFMKIVYKDCLYESKKKLNSVSVHSAINFGCAKEPRFPRALFL